MFGERKEDEEVEDTFDLLDAESRFWGRNIEPFTTDNEAKAWQYIQECVVLAQRGYPTTLEEDIKILEQDDEHKTLSDN